MKVTGRYLLVVATLCGLSAATVGLITNVAGLFFTPMADEFGVMKGTASMTLTIANICVALEAWQRVALPSSCPCVCC